MSSSPFSIRSRPGYAPSPGGSPLGRLSPPRFNRESQIAMNFFLDEDSPLSSPARSNIDSSPLIARVRQQPNLTSESSRNFTIKDEPIFAGEDYTISKVITFNGNRSFTLKQLGKGNSYTVFAIIEEGQIKIGEETVNSKDIVIKIFTNKNNPKDVVSQLTRDLVAYNNLKAHNVPIPRCYITPPERLTQKALKESHKVWIVEKMDKEVIIEWDTQTDPNTIGGQAQQVLEFVKYWHTMSARDGIEYISDFQAQNLMWKDGELKVVDFSYENEDNDTDLQEGLNSALFISLIRWSNGNERIFHGLSEDYPENLRAAMIERLNQLKQENDGIMPTHTNRFMF